MSEEKLLSLFLTLFVSFVLGFLIAWLMRDKEAARQRREVFQARTIATSACHDLRQAYAAQITTIDRLAEQNHQTMTALRQISQWIENFNPRVRPATPQIVEENAPSHKFEFV